MFNSADDLIKKTKIINVNKHSVRNFLIELNKNMPKIQNSFTIQEAMKYTGKNYHVIRNYLKFIVENKPTLISKIDSRIFQLHTRKQEHLNIDDVLVNNKTLSNNKNSNISNIKLEVLYNHFKDKIFTISDMVGFFDVSYNTARRWLSKVINTPELENIFIVKQQKPILFSFNEKEVKKLLK